MTDWAELFDGARMLFRETVARPPMRASAAWEMSA